MFLNKYKKKYQQPHQNVGDVSNHLMPHIKDQQKMFGYRIYRIRINLNFKISINPHT